MDQKLVKKEFVLKTKHGHNDSKITKTINRVLRNANYLLQLEYDYKLATGYFNYRKRQGQLEVFSMSNHEDLFDLYSIDLEIRAADNYLDNVLAKQEIINLKEMCFAVKEFEKMLPEARDVTKLFNAEITLMYDFPEKPKELIEEVIEVRPSDFIFLTDILAKKFGSRLNKKDFEVAREFLMEYYRLRDIIDDIISVDEDIQKNNYNLVIQSQKHSLGKKFIEDKIDEKFDKLKECAKKLSKVEGGNVYDELITFWKSEYALMFLPLLEKYFDSIESFREMYIFVK